MENLTVTQALAAGLLAQAAGSAVLAGLLLVFRRIYRHRYLADWSYSFAGLCAHNLASGIALANIPSTRITDSFRVVLALVSLIAGAFHIAWLLFGTWELTVRPVSQRRRRGVLATLAVLAAILVLGSVRLGAMSYLVRVGLFPLLSGFALCVSGLLVWRWELPHRRLGRLALTSALVLNGLEQVHYFALALMRTLEIRVDYPVYLGFVDLLLQLVLGLALVVVFFDQERLQALTATERIEHLTQHDSLTDLPNRRLLLDRLGSALSRASRYGGRIALLRLDLDRFRALNNTLGAQCADRLLSQVARRLSGCVRASDTVSRLIGDEFVVLLPDVGDRKEVERRCEDLLGLLREPFHLDGQEITLTASVGIARFPEDGSEAEDLLRKADLALGEAKNAGRDQLRPYRQAMGVESADRLALEGDVRGALRRGELVLHYQPVLDAVSRRIRGVEALLRWQHPQRGLLDPHRFLWLIESTGLVHTVDLWVLETACRERMAWQEGGLRDLDLSVNVSAPLLQRADAVESIASVLAATGLPPGLLELEITETLAVEDAAQTLKVLRGLKKLGIRLSIDDFGTGYSSLAYLMHFPLDVLKVDRSFIQALTTDRDGAQIASAVIGLAHSLDLEVVAEGVEEIRQWEIVREQGCDRVQGYLFSPPLPADACYQLIARREPLEPREERGETELAGASPKDSADQPGIG